MGLADVDEQKALNYVRLVEALLGLGITFYCLYAMVPPVTRAVDAKVEQVRAIWRARRQREREINQMHWETFLVSAYPGGRDLGEYLEAS